MSDHATRAHGPRRVTEIETPPDTPADPPDPPPSDTAGAPAEDVPAVPLRQVTWGVTTAAFVVAGVVLLVQAYYGYAIVTLVVAASAAINLW
jgi:hypothetical protein